jgi:MFS family permease
MGVFSSAQFIGAFLGGLLGGLAHERFGAEAVYLVGAGAALVWLLVAVTLRPPAALKPHLLPLGELSPRGAGGYARALLEVPGSRRRSVAPTRASPPESGQWSGGLGKIEPLALPTSPLQPEPGMGGGVERHLSQRT